MSMRLFVLAAAAAALLSACGSDGGSPTPLFPPDFATSYQQVRSCQSSLEHDLMNVKVFASPEAVTPYTGRAAPYPTGAILVKEEYDRNDTACAGAVVFVTAIERLDSGSSPDTIDWHWQKADATDKVVMDDDPSCIMCHTDCGVPPDGYEGTCSKP
jgi:hypothetical protein